MQRLDCQRSALTAWQHNQGLLARRILLVTCLLPAADNECVLCCGPVCIMRGLHIIHMDSVVSIKVSYEVLLIPKVPSLSELS